MGAKQLKKSSYRNKNGAIAERVISMKDTPARGADHHKDDISVDFDRVGCQILDDSIAVGGDRDYPFSSWEILSIITE